MEVLCLTTTAVHQRIQFLQYFTITFHGQYLKQPFASEKVNLILSGVVLNKKWHMTVSHHNL